MSATFELLTDENLITEYVDARIKKELDHVGVFAQFSQVTVLGPQGGSGPADFNYVRSEKTDRGFEITLTAPGAVTRFGKDIYTTHVGQVDIYTGGVELVQELTKAQKWELQQDILEDMVAIAVDYYEKSLGKYLTDNATVQAETTAGSLTFPADLLLGRKAVLDALKRRPDVLMIASNLYDKFLLLPQFIEVDKYGSTVALYNGEVGKIFNMRIIETPLLNAGELGDSKPTLDTMIFLNSDRPTLKTMLWSPLFRFEMWEVKERHVWVHELRGYYDVYIWDGDAVRQMNI